MAPAHCLPRIWQTKQAADTGSDFFDSQRSFVELGYTDVEKITLMKDKTMYLSGNTYYDTAVSGATKIGCYHIDSGETFDSFYDAAQSAESYRSDGVPAFPAYISGEYRVRIEHYSASEYAQSGISKLGAARRVGRFPEHHLHHGRQHCDRGDPV